MSQYCTVIRPLYYRMSAWQRELVVVGEIWGGGENVHAVDRVHLKNDDGLATESEL